MHENNDHLLTGAWWVTLNSLDLFTYLALKLFKSKGSSNGTCQKRYDFCDSFYAYHLNFGIFPRNFHTVFTKVVSFLFGICFYFFHESFCMKIYSLLRVFLQKGHLFDPRGRFPVTAGSDHCFRICRSSVHLYVRPSPLFKTNFKWKQCSLLARLWVWPSGSLVTPVFYAFFRVVHFFRSIQHALYLLLSRTLMNALLQC